MWLELSSEDPILSFSFSNPQVCSKDFILHHEHHYCDNPQVHSSDFLWLPRHSNHVSSHSGTGYGLIHVMLLHVVGLLASVLLLARDQNLLKFKDRARQMAKSHLDSSSSWDQSWYRFCIILGLLREEKPHYTLNRENLI